MIDCPSNDGVKNKNHVAATIPNMTGMMIEITNSRNMIRTISKNIFHTLQVVFFLFSYGTNNASIRYIHMDVQYKSVVTINTKRTMRVDIHNDFASR